MAVSIWSTHLNKQIAVKGSLDEWVDANMEAEEEIAKLKSTIETLNTLVVEDGKEIDELTAENKRLRSSLDAIKRLLDSGFVPQ